eukprot:gene36069-43740_t
MPFCNLSLFLLIFILVVLYSPTEQSTLQKPLVRFGYINVDFGASSRQWSESWPEGIRLINNFSPKILFPNLSSYVNSTTYPYATLTPSARSVRRTYAWVGDTLVVSVNSTSSPLLSRLVPPISWLSQSGCKVRVFSNVAEELQVTSLSPSTDPNAPHPSSQASSQPSPEASTGSSQLPNSLYLESMLRHIDVIQLYASRSPRSGRAAASRSSRVLELSVSKQAVESVLGVLREGGFSREDIFRMLDKAPWLLALNVSGAVLQRLHGDLTAAPLALTPRDSVHIISHCPYLLAMYTRYPGKDVQPTIRTLLGLGYSPAALPALRAEALYVLGKVQHARREGAAAYALYSQSLAHNPEMLLAAYGAAEILMASREYADALQLFEKVLKLKPQDKDSLAYVLLLRGVVKGEVAPLDKLREALGANPSTSSSASAASSSSSSSSGFPFALDLWLSQGELRHHAAKEGAAKAADWPGALRCYAH